MNILRSHCRHAARVALLDTFVIPRDTFVIPLDTFVIPREVAESRNDKLDSATALRFAQDDSVDDFAQNDSVEDFAQNDTTTTQNEGN